MRPTLKLAALQSMIAALAAVVGAMMSGTPAAISALTGGAIAALGSAIYGVFANSGSRAAAGIWKAHVLAEAMKILATILMFALVFLLAPGISGLWLLLGFIAATLMYWVALILVK